MGAIDIGDKITLYPLNPIRPQRFRDHDGPQITAADADIDDVFYLLSCIAFPLAAVYPFAKCLHLRQYPVYIGHDILTIAVYRLPGEIAQGGMQHAAVLRLVDLFPGEHGLDGLFYLGLLRELTQKANGLIRNDVLGKIKKDIIQPERIFENLAGSSLKSDRMWTTFISVL